MEKMDIVYRFLEFLGVAIAGGWVSHILTVRSRVRGARAEAGKAEASVKADEIENIRKTMDDVYRPIIEDLKKQVAKLNEKVSALEEKNSVLEGENDQLRKAMREINPDVVPSKRSVNAQNAPRNANGTFAKRSE